MSLISNVSSSTGRQGQDESIFLPLSLSTFAGAGSMIYVLRALQFELDLTHRSVRYQDHSAPSQQNRHELGLTLRRCVAKID